jgi:hypothetical protein
MRKRIARSITAVLTLAVLVMTVGTAAAAPTHAPDRPAKLCVKVQAGLPKHAKVGEAVGIESGMQNCDKRTMRLKFVFHFDGPCGVREHYHHRYRLKAGEGFGSEELFAIPCAGKYVLEVEAYFGPSLMDRKVRHMKATEADLGSG